MIPNEGTRESPTMGTPLQLKVGDKDVRAPHGDAGPVVADWDNDGRDDLLLGCGDGSVRWYRNVGSATEPELASREILIRAEDDRDEKEFGEGSPRPGGRSKICVADWNSDGQLDLLVGDFSLAAAESKEEPTDEEKAIREQTQERWTELLMQYVKLLQASKSKESNSEGNDEKQKENLATAWSELQDAQTAMFSFGSSQAQRYHGYVWLYLRQDAARIVGKN